MKIMLRYLIPLTIISLSTPALSEQDGVCVLQGGYYKALYHCPDGYDVVIVGDLTPECEGNCFLSNDISSLREVLDQILRRRNITKIPSLELRSASEKVIKGGCAEIILPNREKIAVCAGRGWH